MFSQLANKIIIFASFLVIVGYVWFRLKKISKNKVKLPPTQETCPSLTDLPIKLPIEWEITKQKRKRLLLHLFPIIVSLLIFIWLPLFIKEMEWRTGLALGLESFTDLSQTKAMVRNKSSRSSIDLGFSLRSYYKKVGGAFKIYLKPQTGHQVSEFNRFILVTEPENTKQVKGILAKYLNFQPTIHNKKYTELIVLVPVLVAFLIIVIFLMVA
ncbi:MAG: hypothetical protein ABH896_00890 [Candidatus Jacksonbacteria bacterium]